MSATRGAAVVRPRPEPVGWLARRNVPTAGTHLITRKNVYLLPTRAGVTLGLVIFVMLVASVNYQLALGYALCFLVTAVAIVSMLHAWRNLTALVLRPGRSAPVFAGDFAELAVFVANPGRHERFALSLWVSGATDPEDFDAPAECETLVSVAIPAPDRGWLQVPRLRMETRFPIGLWRAWTWWQPAARILVYPRPEAGHVPLPAGVAGEGEGETCGSSEEDLAALRPWRSGDSVRRIAWKAVARADSGALVVRQFEGGTNSSAEFAWDQLPSTWDTERRLSRLTRWVIDAEIAGIAYSLRLPAVSVGADSGPAHRDRCLELLATCQPMPARRA